MKRPAIYDIHQIDDCDAGYYGQPTLFGDQIVFVSEDDLWTVPVDGGVARRLTVEDGHVSSPAFSPDGSTIAYTSTEQGCPEVFVLPAQGGPSQKLTFSGASTAEVVGWTPDGEHVLFRSNLREPFRRRMTIYQVPAAGGEIERFGVGDAHRVTFEQDGPGRALVRHRDDLAWWKNYRGGQAGQLWIDLTGEGEWTQLLAQEDAGICRPMWVGDRIYFLSDLDGASNLHSCTVDGKDLRRHTDSGDHYVRFAARRDTRIVYTCGADLFLLDTTAGESPRQVPVTYPSTRSHLKSTYVDATEFLHDFALHPKGHSLVVESRGKPFNFGNWEGAVRQTGERHGVRYRLPRYIGDGDEILVVSDASGEERLEVHDAHGQRSPRLIELGDAEVGRLVELEVAPDGEQVIFTNHRYEIWHLNLATGATAQLDRSPADPIADIVWGPHSQHIAYAYPLTNSTAVIKIYDLHNGDAFMVTSGEFNDQCPAFDPEGRYLYFLSYRHFDPIRDQFYHDLSFAVGVKPCVVTLSADEESPFVRHPRPLDGDDDGDSDNGGDSDEESDEAGDGDDGGDEEETPSLVIDAEGITDRVELFPVSEGNYQDIWATDERVFWTTFPLQKRLILESKSPGRLDYFDLKKQKVESFAKGVSGFVADRQGKTLVLWNDDTLQVVSATGGGPEEEDDTPGRDTGFVDLERVSVAVDRRAEWCQMLRETWRLMRDQFWRTDMGGVDWDAVWDRYKQLLPRVATRREFSDLVWTMQGELGTSHAYEFGGHYDEPPEYRPGMLGAELRWDDQWRLASDSDRFGGALRIDKILRGDPWDRSASSPLRRPGLNVADGDVILAVNGQPVLQRTSIGELLTDQAARDIELLIADGDGQDEPRRITVKALGDEQSLRYRDWVALNRKTVHEATDGQIGYVHIPDMGFEGYAEFHRQYLSEQRRAGLVVDVRFNGGGFVSQMILEKLRRKPIGFDLKRHGAAEHAYTYPAHSVAGPLVALTSPEAGSDGDVFSHCFKKYGLGPLIGERTWGGTIGIWPRHELVDGSWTTQPEYAFWFEDVGFGLENRGAEPDVVLPYPPDATAGPGDPQLQKAIEIVLELLEQAEILEPPVVE